jgi:transcription elongation factor GreA
MFLDNQSNAFAQDPLVREQPPAPAGDDLPVTAAAHQALESERAALRHEKLRELPERLRLVREFGDIANNDEYHAIREEETLLDARLARLDDILSRARIVDPAGSDGTIAIGSSVTVREHASGRSFDYVIDSAHAPAAPHAVSAASPVGRALLGRSIGDVVVVDLPRKGRTRELEVVAVGPLSAA